MADPKDVLTTGEVASICNVAPRTVSKWFDSGQIRGYRIPGSRDRRIPLSSLARFMRQHQIPMDGLLSGQTRVLIVDEPGEVSRTLKQVLVEQAQYEVRLVDAAFAAGAECEKFRPHVMLLDIHLGGVDGSGICRHVRENPDLQLTRVVGMSEKLTGGQARQLLRRGFDGYLKKPFHTQEVIEAIEDAAAVVH